MTDVKKRQLLTYVIFLQTLGPILVILGHSINGLPYHAIFNPIKNFIYVFHMPLFFFIAGITFYYTTQNKEIKYFEFVKKKAIRLMIPYIFWNLLFLIPKYFLSGFLEDKVELSLKYIIRMFFYPRDNVCGTSWFLFALFVTYCFAPLFKKCLKNKVIFGLIFLVFFALSMFPLDTFFLTLSDLTKDVVFFLLGMWIFKYKEKLLENKYTLLIVILNVVSFALWVIFNNRITTAILCLFILILLLIIGLKYQNVWKENIISKNGFFIFLFHWFFILGARIIIYQKLHFNYYLTVVLLIFVGLLGPILAIKIIDKLKLREKSKFLKIVLG